MRTTDMDKNTYVYEIAQKAAKNKANIIVLSDYDGCLAGFRPKPLECSPTGGKENFLNTIKNLEKSGIPFYILTSRKIEDFSEKGVISDAAEKTNLIGLKGNQVRAVLPFDKEKISSFAEKNWAKSDGYQKIIKEIDGNKTFLSVEPVPLKEFSKVKSHIKADLEPLGFFIEDKKIMYTLHWRGLEETVKDKSKCEESHEIRVNPELFLEISEKYSSKENEYNVIIINKEDNLSTKVKLVDLIEFGQNKFENICKKELKDEIKDGKVSLHLDEATKIYEVIDSRVDKNNKGRVVEIFTELFSAKSRVHPLVLGDSFGTNKGTVKDDEHAMKAAAKLLGTPIAIEAREHKEIENGINPNRKTVNTAAMYKLSSYEESLKFLNTLAEVVREVNARSK